MKVLDIIEECQSEARKTPKENAPAVGKHTATSFSDTSVMCNSMSLRKKHWKFE